MTLTKIDITEYLIEKYQLQKSEAKSLVDNFFEEIRLSLESGNKVKNLPARDVIPKPVKA